MKNLLRYTVLFAVFVYLLSDVAQAPRKCDSECEAKRMIVQVICELDNNTSKGSGIIVGVKDDLIYIITARHVVRNGPDYARNPKIVFPRLRPGKTFDTKLLFDQDPDWKIAILSVVNDDKLNLDVAKLRWNILESVDRLKERDKVFIVGSDGKTSPYEHFDSQTGRKITVYSQVVEDGDSGGGLFTDDWILIGMIHTKATPRAYADSIESIVDLLSSWNYGEWDYGPAKLLATALVPSPSEQSDDMVHAPAGDFMMGCNSSVDKYCSDHEKPYHKVYLDEFYIDKFEVTVGQYQECVNTGKCKTAHFDDGLCFVYQREKWNRGKLSKSFRVGNHPAVCVDWYQAKAYCESVDKRLPTEAEWEKAARGTDGRFFPWGNSWNTSNVNYCDLSCGQTWKDRSSDDGYANTSPIGNYPRGASPYGAMDMAGNVWEWTADWYDGNYYSGSSKSNPKGPSTGKYRVVHGGSWADTHGNLRVSARLKNFPTWSSSRDGFRCAK